MNGLNFSPFPTIKTERLILRQLAIEDAEEVYALRTNKEVLNFIDRPPSRNINEGLAFVERIAKNIANNTALYWAIAIIDDPKLIGSICLWNFSEDNQKAEVGFELFPKYQGLGIMNEALGVVLNFGFNSGRFETIEAFTHKDNLSSKSLLLRHGFKEDIGRVDKDNANNIIYKITK